MTVTSTLGCSIHHPAQIPYIPNPIQLMAPRCYIRPWSVILRKADPSVKISRSQVLMDVPWYYINQHVCWNNFLPYFLIFKRNFCPKINKSWLLYAFSLGDVKRRSTSKEMKSAARSNKLRSCKHKIFWAFIHLPKHLSQADWTSKIPSLWWRSTKYFGIFGQST